MFNKKKIVFVVFLFLFLFLVSCGKKEIIIYTGKEIFLENEFTRHGKQ